MKKAHDECRDENEESMKAAFETCAGSSIYLPIYLSISIYISIPAANLPEEFKNKGKGKGPHGPKGDRKHGSHEGGKPRGNPWCRDDASVEEDDE